MPKLLNRFVESIVPDPKREFVVWDEELHGFGLRVWPSGKRVFIVKYRTQLGRQRKVTIGECGTLSPMQARKRAPHLLSQVKLGEDPAGILSASRKSPTIADLAERYMREHARPKKRPRSAEGDETLLRLHVLPAMGALKTASVKREDISRLHHAMRDRPGAANRTIALLSKMFNLAELWGLRSDNTNPCRHVSKYRENKIERFLTSDELARLGKVLADVEFQRTELPSVVPALKILILTGCRVSEILTLKWSDVDIERRRIRLRESKTGPKTIYLSRPVTDVLSSIRRTDENPYVIAGAKPSSHLVNLKKPWYRIRAKAGLVGVRIHDLRHTYASSAAAGGVSLLIIGALLGHKQPQTTHRYAHLAADPIQQAASQTGDFISSALERIKRN